MARFRSDRLAVCAALTFAGCGGVDIELPDFDAPRDRMTVIVDGQRTTVAQSGSVDVRIDGVPELSYSGPLGCKGRYFTDSESDVYFRYDARRAHLLRLSTLYRFGAPRRVAGQLAWNGDFDGSEVSVLVNCPQPPRSSG
jgi:hypothetical protein